MMSKLKVPPLRFSEFNSNWNYEKFNDLYPKVRNGFVGTATPFYVETGIPYLQGKNIKNGSIDIKGLIYINNSFHQKNKKSQLQENDIVMVQSGHVGECALITESFINSNCHALLVSTPIDNVDSKFYVYYFYSEIGKKIIHKITTGNTIKHILSSDLKIQFVSNPSLPEQKKIVSFLTAVDNKIEQLSKKYTLLQDYKKGMMQKIFSQEIQFKDDDGSEFPQWEEKKISTVSTVNPFNITLPNSFVYIDLESVKSGSLLKESILSKKEAPSRAQRILEKNDILYQTVRPYQKNNYLFNLEGNYVASTGYAQLRAYENSAFLYHCLHQNKFVNKVLSMCTGTSYPAINTSDLKSIKINMPSNKEQTKIATFLTSIDTKIEQNNKQLIQTKLFKKALLQQMFV